MMTLHEFIIQHTKINKYINYCEIIILPNGKIEYANPSHIEKLVDISGRSKEDLSILMPHEASVVEWLADYTGCCSIWYDFGILPEQLNDRQTKTIKGLIKHKILSNNFYGYKRYEKRICELLFEHDVNQLQKYHAMRQLKVSF